MPPSTSTTQPGFSIYSLDARVPCPRFLNPPTFYVLVILKGGPATEVNLTWQELDGSRASGAQALDGDNDPNEYQASIPLPTDTYDTSHQFHLVVTAKDPMGHTATKDLTEPLTIPSGCR